MVRFSKSRFALVLAVLGSLACMPAAHADGWPENFEAAKRMLRQVYAPVMTDIYCGCTFNARSQLTGHCPVKVDKHVARVRRLEWEHVVPASDFGRQRACWRNHPSGVSGREHCRQTDETFRSMEADPFNLKPSVGALNAIRSNYRYGEVPGEQREFGACDFEVSPAGAGRFVEPPESVKGDVARVYFYFEQTYGLRIGRAQRQLFEAWASRDPIDEQEIGIITRVSARVGVPVPPVWAP